MSKNILIKLLFFILAIQSISIYSQEEILITHDSSYGVFDPSICYDPVSERIWMVFSSVDQSVWPENKTISTCLAYSEDYGQTWIDTGIIINPSEDILLPGDIRATWVNEVADLCYIENAPIDERWMLIWHRYLLVGGSRLFEHSWISLKTAATPESLQYATEHKLFTGVSYNNVNDITLGEPEFNLSKLHTDLSSVLVFSEPSILFYDNTIYITMLAADMLQENSSILLIKRHLESSEWVYCGKLLVNGYDGTAFGFSGFSAPSLFVSNDMVFLIATPQINHKYLGTYIFEIQDINMAFLKRVNGKPILLNEIYGRINSHNGAADYIPESINSGILYSDILITDEFIFKIYSSGINPLDN